VRFGVALRPKPRLDLQRRGCAWGRLGVTNKRLHGTQALVTPAKFRPFAGVQSVTREWTDSRRPAKALKRRPSVADSSESTLCPQPGACFTGRPSQPSRKPR
jgi:hypothetical protein